MLEREVSMINLGKKVYMEMFLQKMKISLMKILIMIEMKIIVIIQMIIIIILHHLLHLLLILLPHLIKIHIKIQAFHPRSILLKILLVFHHNLFIIHNQNLFIHLDLLLHTHLNHHLINVHLLIIIVIMIRIQVVLTLHHMKMNMETLLPHFILKAMIFLLHNNHLHHPSRNHHHIKKEHFIIQFTIHINLILMIFLNVSLVRKIIKLLQ